MQLIFDLDGCLVDTREAHRMSYEMAGVRFIPSDFYHTSSHGWATPEQRRLKAGFYEENLHKHGKLLPAADILFQFGGLVMSGCSKESVDALLKVFPEFGSIGIMCEFSLDEKIKYLNLHDPGMYFDDWSVMLDRVRGETKWKAIDASKL